MEQLHPTSSEGELLLSVEEISTARSRGDQPSDGGGTGRSDLNDNAHH